MGRAPRRWIMVEGHVCDYCGQQLIRKTYPTQRESESDYLRRRFCGHACMGAAMHQTRVRESDGFVLCSGCDDYKPPDAYSSNAGYCRDCQRKRDKARRMRPATREAQAESMKRSPPKPKLPGTYVHPGVTAPAPVVLTYARELKHEGLAFASDVLASVPESATGLVTPLFQTEARAKLWNSMLRNRTGRTEWSE